jgi:hypothetical protein
MRMTRAEMAVTVVALGVFLGPVLLRPAAPPGRPELGMGVARRMLEELVERGDLSGRPETFVYGHTPDEPAYYSYAVFSRSPRPGIYELDVQIRWKGVVETKTSKGSRPMEVHLGRLVDRSATPP